MLNSTFIDVFASSEQLSLYSREDLNNHVNVLLAQTVSRLPKLVGEEFRNIGSPRWNSG